MKALLIIALFCVVELAYGVPPINPSFNRGAKEGEDCGGILGISCEDGLQCIGNEVRFPDGQGTCRRKGAEEGEDCGGILGIACGNGLKCIGKAARVPDGLGTCRRKGAKEGEDCGGILGIACGDGLECTGKAVRIPDGLGTCRRKKAKEGEACGGRQGPWCEEGFQCIGKAVLVDGQGTCRRDAANCPTGVLPVNCFVDPCDGAACASNAEDTTCVTSYCGDCKAVFYDYDGKNVVNCEISPITRCKNPGKTVPSPHDACNTCECLDDGTIGGCTEKLCFEVTPIIRCKNPGETVPSPHDACNKCECSDDGTIGGCTKMLCFEDAKEGEDCGGIVGTLCGDGLQCIGKDVRVPDGQGTCRRKAVKKCFNPYDKLIYCATNDANYCEEKTDGVFNSCHNLLQPSCLIDNEIVKNCYGICVPEDQTCSPRKPCKSIGTKNSGLLSSRCQDNKCEYAPAIVIA